MKRSYDEITESNTLVQQLQNLPIEIQDEVCQYISGQTIPYGTSSTETLQKHINMWDFDFRAPQEFHQDNGKYMVFEPLLQRDGGEEWAWNLFKVLEVAHFWGLDNGQAQGYLNYQNFNLMRNMKMLAHMTPYDVTSRAVTMPVHDIRVGVVSPLKVVPATVKAVCATDQAHKDVYHAWLNKNVCMMALKAWIFTQVFTGQMAMAHDGVNFIGRQMSLWSLMARVVYDLADHVAWAVGVLAYLPLLIAEAMSEEFVALLELIAVCVTFYATIMILRFMVDVVRKFVSLFVKRLVLRGGAKVTETRYLAKRLTEHGVVHEIIAEGKLYILPDVVETTNVTRDEMALPGSSLFPSKGRPVGAILAAVEGTELSVVGCFFRIDNNLVTCMHVANAITNSVAKVYLGSMKVGKRDLYRLDIGSVIAIDNEFFEMERSGVQSNVYDVFTRVLDVRMWAKLAIGCSSTKKPSCYNQTVSACGFRGAEGLFVTSSGKTLPKSGLETLWHTSTTEPGFSGSPLYAGNSVIGMHTGAAGDKNVAIRIELIMHLLRAVPESNMPDIENVKSEFKFKGRHHSVRQLMETDLWGFEDDSGYVDYPWTKEEVELMMKNRENPMVEGDIDDLLDPDTTPLTGRSYKKLMRYVDESAPLFGDFAASVPTAAKTVIPTISTTPRTLNGVVRYAKLGAVHSSKTPMIVEEVADYMAEHASELVKLGYEPEKYVYPEITPDTEATSVVKHLEMYASRTKSVEKPPTEKEIRAVTAIMVEMMRENKYEPDADYDSIEKILSVIDSSAVKSSKSPGQPHQANGIATNEQMLQRYTKEGLAELIKREWDTPNVELKAFIKGEPTKVKKVDAGMPRIVTGMPLEKMVKNNCVFANFSTVLVDRWKHSPIKFAFNPIRAGDIGHLASVFGDGMVVGSDKSNWDYNYFKWLFNIVEGVTKELAVRPDGMSEEKFEKYLSDVSSCFSEVTDGAKYRCSNGEVFGPEEGGIMKSGWFMTIIANSMGQLALHVLAMLRSGYSSAQIQSREYGIIVGGDDVLQTFPAGMDLEKYREVLKELGFIVTDFEVRKGFEGCEFFSNVFSKREGVWTYTPTRFTKHIAHLQRTKMADLANALSCHMLNHVWSNKKFTFFDTMFKKFRKEQPELFPLSLYKSQRQLQYKVLGLESA